MNITAWDYQWGLAKCIARDVGLFRGPQACYPPLCLWRPISWASVRRAWDNMLGSGRPARSAPIGVFVNVPFCAKQCRYCDYVAMRGVDGRCQNSYADAIEREIAALPLQSAVLRPDSLYISGGDLAGFATDRLERLFDVLLTRLNFRSGFHCRAGFGHTPINREMARTLSRWRVRETVILVQTLDASLSHRIRRPMTPGGLGEMCSRLRGAGISHIKIEWMVGLPGQTMSIFQRDMEALFAACPDEVVVAPFRPAPYSMFWAMQNPSWRPKNVSPCRYSRVDILRRSRMVDMARKQVMLENREKRNERMGAGAEGSVLGLGPGALSHLYGTLRYAAPGGAEGQPENLRGSQFFGIHMDSHRELRRLVIEGIAEGLLTENLLDRISTTAQVGTLCGEIDALKAAGLIVRREDGWRFCRESELLQRIASVLFYEDTFRRWFGKRRALHANWYRGIGRQLVSLYDSGVEVLESSVSGFTKNPI